MALVDPAPSGAVLQHRATPSHGITFREAFWVWVKVAALSFGGRPVRLRLCIASLSKKKKWIGETRFLHALNYCMLLPGPEAQQLTVYIGWLLHKTKGGLVAGTLFVLPGVVAIMALSWIYAAYGKVGVVQALFFGLKAAVLAVVLEAVVRVGKRALKNNVMVALAGTAFVAIFFSGLIFLTSSSQRV
jgi:chromate transporter